MKRALVVTVAALIALASSGVAAATPDRANTEVKYEISYTGLVLVNHKDNGTQANGSCTQFPKDEAPFTDHYNLKVAWDAEFKFAFNPEGSGTSAVNAKLTRIHGSHFSYGGSFYNDGCNKVTYGPNGKPCTGVVANHGSAFMIASLKSKKPSDKLKFDIAPFGALTGNPSSCKDSDTPPATYTAEDEMGLSSLSDQLTSHVFSTVEKIAGGVKKTVEWSIDINKNCTAKGADPGDTDRCSTVWTGAAFLVIQPLS